MCHCLIIISFFLTVDEIFASFMCLLTLKCVKSYKGELYVMLILYDLAKGEEKSFELAVFGRRLRNDLAWCCGLSLVSLYLNLVESCIFSEHVINV